MNIKKMYYYLFYKLYKFFEAAPSRWWSDWKAAVVILVLEICFIISLLTYFVLATGKYEAILTGNGTYIIILLLTIPLNVYFFVISDEWKEYVNCFEKLPKRKNIWGGWIVLTTVLFVLANFIFSIYLYYQS